MRKILLFIIIILPSIFHAQIIIQGKIKDLTNNEPLIGAFVSVNGSNLTSVSDEKGAYSLIVPTPKEAVKLILSVSHLGYKDLFVIVDALPIDDGENIFKSFELEPDPLTLKRVIVEANKVEEELQDVPIAASVIDAKEMERRTVSNTQEAFSSVPNMVTDAYLPSRATFSIRGLASDFTNLGVENSVGMYIDDVYHSRSFNFNSTLFDIERVEVLRGPQGTLFGKNTIGGVLHVHSEKPKFGNFGSIELSAGNFTYLQARGKANFQLVEDKLALRLTGAYRKRDGYLLEENSDVADQNGTLFYGGRASLRYKPNSNIDIVLKGSYSKDDRADFTIDYKVPDSGFNTIAVDSTQHDHFDRRVSQNEKDVFFKREGYSTVGKIDVKLGKIHKLTSVTAYNSTTSSFLRDFDATSVNAGVFGKDSEISAFSQEIRIATPRENRKLFYIAGLYYLKEQLINNDTLGAKPGLINLWEALFAQRGIPLTLPDDYNESVRNGSVIDATSYAAFLSGSYEFTERIRLNAGIRFSHEEKTINYWQRCNCPLPLPPLAFLVAPPLGSESTPIERSVDNSVASGNIGMDFKTTDKVLIYINLSRGFKGAGFNVSFTPDGNPDASPFTFKREILNSYEIGLKLRQSNRIQFNAAAFITDFRDKQEVVASGNQVFVANAKAVQGQGIEAEFTGVWNKFFKTDVSMGALNLKYLDFPFVDPFTMDSLNLSGNRAFKAPSFTFKFAPEFHTQLGKELKVLLRLDYNYVGKAYNDIFNTESLARQGTGILNARLAFTTRNERFSLAIWGKNLTEQGYIQHAWSFIFGDHVAINPPRMIGVELRANFY